MCANGSFIDSKIDIGARDGWCIVVIDEGNYPRRISESIPRGIPQTAVLAEFHGLMHAVKHQERPSPRPEDQCMAIDVDCSALIWGAQDVKKASTGKMTQSGHWKRIKALAPKEWNMHNVNSAQAKRNTTGNTWVDAFFAKEAARFHKSLQRCSHHHRSP